MKKIISFAFILLTGFAVFAEDVSVSIEDRVPYPENYKNLTAEEINLKVFKVLTEISTQKGLQYISRMAGFKPKTLFEESYCISDLDDKKSKIDDPEITTLSDEYTLYAYQKDNRFGGNTYVVNYRTDEKSVELEIINHTPIRFAGVSCVKEEQLTMKLKVEQSAETNEFIIIGSAFVPNQKPKVSFLFYTVDLENSFNRRVTALKNWFAAQIGVKVDAEERAE